MFYNNVGINSSVTEAPNNLLGSPYCRHQTSQISLPPQVRFFHCNRLFFSHFLLLFCSYLWLREYKGTVSTQGFDHFLGEPILISLLTSRQNAFLASLPVFPQLVSSFKGLVAIGTHVWPRARLRFRFWRGVCLWWQESWQAGCPGGAVGRFPEVHVKELPILVHPAAHVALEVGQGGDDVCR